MRIVSLLPSTTEILFAIGAGDDVVGVTFECDFPAEARSRRIVSTSAMPEGLTPAEIDAYVVGAMAARRGPLPPVGRRARRARRRPGRHPGPVRGLRGRRVGRRRRARPPRLPRRGADHRPAHPRRGVRLDRGAGRGDRPRGRGRRAGRRRCGRGSTPCGARVAGLPRPRVMLLEWTDPPYAPGHWVPEMIEAAGGTPPARQGRREVRAGAVGVGARGRARTSIVCAPCGYDLAGAQRLADELVASGVLPRRRTRARRRRQRLLGPARHPAGRRGRGAGRDPAPRVTGSCCPASAPACVRR